MGHRTLRRAARLLIEPAQRGRERWDRAATRALVRRVTGDGSAEVRRARRSRGGVRILIADGSTIGRVVLKVTRIPAIMPLMEREGSTLNRLHHFPPSSRIRALVPVVVTTGRDGPWAYLVQRMLPGEPAARFMVDAQARDRLLTAGAELAAEIHGVTATRRPVATAEVARWIERPAHSIRLLLDHRQGRLLDEAVDRARACLPDEVDVGTIHGDFWMENILVDRTTLDVTGIVDWDSSVPDAPVLHDLLHLVLYERKKRLGTEVGHEICAALGSRDAWDDAERTVFDRAVRSIEGGPGTRDARRTVLLLYWLRLVSVNLERQPHLARTPRWLDDNVRRVVSCL